MTGLLWALIVVIGLIVIVVIWFMGAYNGLVRLRNEGKNAWAQIDVQLKRRHDLIPNLVETAKGYMTHERETLEAVVKARNVAAAANGAGEASKAESGLSGALGQFMVVVERYPRPEGEPEFPVAAGGAVLHREPHRLRPAGLQRRGHTVQHAHRNRTHQHRGGRVQLPAHGTLRTDRGRGARSAEGPLLSRTFSFTR